jgi:hypothetical protein
MLNIFKTKKPSDTYGYDFDGVISIGITPRASSDVIITGRCIDEQDEVRAILKERGIKCKVYFNPMTLAMRGNHTVHARRFSGHHKANTINRLKNEGVIISRFFEDDPIQYQIIQEAAPEVELVNIVSKLVQK